MQCWALLVVCEHVNVCGGVRVVTVRRACIFLWCCMSMFSLVCIIKCLCMIASACSWYSVERGPLFLLEPMGEVGSLAQSRGEDVSRLRFQHLLQQTEVFLRQGHSVSHSRRSVRVSVCASCPRGPGSDNGVNAVWCRSGGHADHGEEDEDIIKETLEAESSGSIVFSNTPHCSCGVSSLLPFSTGNTLLGVSCLVF